MDQRTGLARRSRRKRNEVVWVAYVIMCIAHRADPGAEEVGLPKWLM